MSQSSPEYGYILKVTKNDEKSRDQMLVEREALLRLTGWRHSPEYLTGMEDTERERMYAVSE